MQINPPTDYYGFTGSGVPLEVINALGYNPSYPYGDFGSGVPTRKAFGALGNIIGGGLGGAAVPGLGNIVGAGAGGKFGSWLGKLFNNWRMNQGAGGASGGGGGGGGSATGGGGTRSSGGGGGFDIFGPRWSASGTPGVGVGIDPMGNPARGREWWSPDFGRWTTDKTGDFPGDYNLGGPGGTFGTRGLPTGHTVQNWTTAIGFGGPGFGSGGTSARIGALGGGALARGLLGHLAQAYAANPDVRVRGSDTRALVGGAPGSVFSPWMLNQHPMGGPGSIYAGGTPIFNPAAFGASGLTGAPGGTGHPRRAIE